MNRKTLSLAVLILTLLTFVAFTQTVAFAAPVMQDEPIDDAPPAQLLRVQISESVPFTLTSMLADDSAISGTLTDTVTATQGISYVLDLVLDFELDTRIAESMTMTVPSTVTVMSGDGMTMTLPISFELTVEPSALVTVTALPAPAAAITATAEVTESEAVSEEITATPSVTSTPQVTTTPPVTATPTVTPSETVTEPVDTGPAEIGTTTTVTANLRAAPSTDAEIVRTAGPDTPITPVATNEDGAWYLLDDATWIFSELVSNPPADLPVATEELIQQVTEEAAASATPTPTPAPTATPVPEPTAVPTVAATETVTATVPATDTASTGPVSPTVTVNANLRAGPGTDFEQIGGTITGQVITIIGQNEAGDWYLLDNGGWIFANLVENAPANIPVVPDDATPESVGAPQTPQGPALPTPTPRPAEPVALGPEETAYGEEVRGLIGQYGVTVATLTALGNNAVSDPTKLQDANWNNAVNAAIATLRSTGEQVRNLDPPPLFAATQIDMVAAANAFDEAADLAEQGLSEANLDLVQQAVTKVAEGEALLASATEKLDAVAS